VIKEIVPALVIQYLKKEWWDDHDLWSAVAHKEWSELEISDTNMLVEA
jgi:hypothetical protein